MGRASLAQTVSVLFLALLTISLGGNLPVVPASHGPNPTDLGVWSDTYRSNRIADAAIRGGEEFVAEMNATNIPQKIAGTNVTFNGFDITIQYDASLVKVSSATRISYNGSGEDSIVSVTPVRVPILEEADRILRSFPATPKVKFIDQDADTKYLIGETLVLDADNDNVVDAGERVVSVTPDRAPTSGEIGRALRVESSIRFYDGDSDTVYDLGELLVFDLDDNLVVSKPMVQTGIAVPACHFYEGCLFDNTRGATLQGRVIYVLGRSCDSGCTSTSSGSTRLSLLLLGMPTIPIPVQGLSGTLFRVQFKTQGTPASPLVGTTIINLASSTLTSPLTGPIHHDKINGTFSNVNCPDVNGDGFVNIDDLAAVGAAFGSTIGDPAYNPNADFNQDGAVNIDDLASVGTFFGKACP